MEEERAAVGRQLNSSLRIRHTTGLKFSRRRFVALQLSSLLFSLLDNYDDDDDANRTLLLLLT